MLNKNPNNGTKCPVDKNYVVTKGQLAALFKIISIEGCWLDPLSSSAQSKALMWRICEEENNRWYLIPYFPSEISTCSFKFEIFFASFFKFVFLNDNGSYFGRPVPNQKSPTWTICGVAGMSCSVLLRRSISTRFFLRDYRLD